MIVKIGIDIAASVGIRTLYIFAAVTCDRVSTVTIGTGTSQAKVEGTRSSLVSIYNNVVGTGYQVLANIFRGSTANGAGGDYIRSGNRVSTVFYQKQIQIGVQAAQLNVDRTTGRLKGVDEFGAGPVIKGRVGSQCVLPIIRISVKVIPATDGQWIPTGTVGIPSAWCIAVDGQQARVVGVEPVFQALAISTTKWFGTPNHLVVGIQVHHFPQAFVQKPTREGYHALLKVPAGSSSPKVVDATFRRLLTQVSFRDNIIAPLGAKYG